MSQNIWIVTIGSSDVQLKSSDLWWNSWCPKIEHELHGNSFEPSKTEQITWGETGGESEKTTYRLPARVLGLAYNALPEQVGKYLTFPLLEKFVQQFREEQITPTKIVVILTNQNNFFIKEDKEKDACPYWQDTCFLKRALADCFFGSDVYGLKGIEINWIVLSPQNKDDQKYGLDDWNRVLDLVKTKLREFKKKQKLELKLGHSVYVSHQAGTPAISSAVQFVCLAEFEKQFQVEGKPPQQTVRFLVSNEYGSTTKPIKSSEYLRGIRKQEALALLERHDYSGIKTLIGHYLSPCEQILLEAAIQWNHSEFEEFSSLLKSDVLLIEYSKLSNIVQERTKKENWWWTAYESAYLAVFRLEQSNFVEAIFHSFRSVEGLLKEWVKADFSIKNKKIYSKGDEPKPFRKIDGRKYNAYGKDLYWFLDKERTIKEAEHNHIWKFGNLVFDRRNDLFHNLKGLRQLEDFEQLKDLKGKEAVFRFWEITSENEKDWIDRVLACLNFISKQNYECLNFDQGETDDKEASLMAKVHQELENAIASL